MKKKLIILSSIVMFSIGLAVYANNSSAMNVLTEDNIEALTDNETVSNNTIQETGTYPHRVWIDHEAHTITLEGYTKVRNSDTGKYDCISHSGSICTISTDAPVRKTSAIAQIISSLASVIFSGLPFWKWVVSLFV